MRKIMLAGSSLIVMSLVACSTPVSHADAVPTVQTLQTDSKTAQLLDKIELPFERFTLENGLTVLVHSDHTVPTVFVGMWYDVGSKDEPAGKSGFAHLFEHLMFQGTANRDGEYFEPFNEVGANGMNGSTSKDRTNYFATVPSGALDMALWMESDRMAHLLGGIDQAILDEQRGVVRNEKRQGENRPYAKLTDMIDQGIYPPSHPYYHSIIGSMADINAATLDDGRGVVLKSTMVLRMLCWLCRAMLRLRTPRQRQRSILLTPRPANHLPRKMCGSRGFLRIKAICFMIVCRYRL